MIISHKHRYIFIKTGKTGGSSVEHFLSAHCGPDDVVTGLSDPRESLLQTARNTRLPLHRSLYVSMPIPPILPDRKHRRSTREFYQHMPAFRVRRALPARIWRTYLSFTIARNPFDLAVSQYYWNTKATMGTRQAVSDYVLSAPPYRLTNWHMYALGDRVIVDEILRYEHLADGLRGIVERTGMGADLLLPHAKGGIRPPGSHYRDLLSAAARNRIEIVARRELDHLSYAW